MMVARINYDEVTEWLLKRHYAKRIPCITKAFGLYLEKELIGVCTFGVPASPSLCVGVCGERFKGFVLELNRLCIEDGAPKNAASFFVSKCLSYMRGGGQIIVSYADTGMNHVGYVYQACNFLYTGITKERTDIGTEDGSHSRHYSKNCDYKKDRKTRTAKHRYVYFCGRKHFKKLFMEHLNYPILPYPKGDTKRYDASADITKQGVLFV